MEESPEFSPYLPSDPYHHAEEYNFWSDRRDNNGREEEHTHRALFSVCYRSLYGTWNDHTNEKEES